MWLFHQMTIHKKINSEPLQKAKQSQVTIYFKAPEIIFKNDFPTFTEILIQNLHKLCILISKFNCDAF
jgi:hypothetical protein